MGMLQNVVFGPMEALITPLQIAEKFYVVQQGLVMTQGMAIVSTGGSVGDDALYVFRHGQTRGYQATTMSHGRAIALVATDVLQVSVQLPHQMCSCSIQSRNCSSSSSFARLQRGTQIVLALRNRRGLSAAHTFSLAAFLVRHSPGACGGVRAHTIDGGRGAACLARLGVS